MAESRVQLLPVDPAHLRALLQSVAQFKELSGLRVVPAIRDFLFMAPPEYRAKVEEATEPDVWTFGFAVVLQENSTWIGSAGFKGAPDAAGMVEIAYGVAPEYEGRGLATEVAHALVDYAFARPEVRLARAHTLPERNASCRVLEKTGFQFLGPVMDPEDGLVWRWERPKV